MSRVVERSPLQEIHIELTDDDDDNDHDILFGDDVSRFADAQPLNIYEDVLDDKVEGAKADMDHRRPSSSLEFIDGGGLSCNELRIPKTSNGARSSLLSHIQKRNGPFE